MATIRGIKAGTTTITASYGGEIATASITVSNIAPTLTYTKTPGDIIYDGITRKAIGTVTYNGDGQVYYLVINATSQPSTPSASATTGTGWVEVANGGTVYATNSAPSGAGTYWVFLRSTAGTNYTAVNPKYGNNKEILKDTGDFGTITNPEAQTYRCNNTSYSFAIGFSGATGTVNYPTSISVTKSGSTGTVSGWGISGSTVTAPAGTAAGTYTVIGSASVAESDNYNAVGSTSKSWTITINKNNDASVTVTLASNAGTYGSTATLVMAANSSSHGTSAAYIGYKYGSAATADSEITWVNVGTALTLSATAAAGTYYIYKKWTADGNHSNNQSYMTVGTSYTLTRSKDTPTLTLTNTDAMYHNTAKVTGTASVAGTIYWGTASNSMTNTKAATAGTPVDLTTRTTLGSTTVYAYFVPTDTTNYNSLGTSSSAHTSKEMTVSQATDASVEPTVNTNTLTYDGSNQELITGVTAHGTSSYQIGYKLGSAATADNQITWSSANATTLSATTAGTYYLYKKWTADGNHSNNQTYTTIGTTYTKVIDKETPKFTLRSSDTIYPTTAYIKGTASVAGTVNWGTSSSSMTSTQVVSAGTETNITSQTSVGTKTIYAYFTPTDTTNYNSLGSSSSYYVSKSVNVSGGTLNVTATPYNAEYDGNSHAGITSISAENQDGTTVYPTFTYCATETGAYSSTIPTVQNYTTGTPIYWKATLTGYTTATGSVNAVVSKRNVSISSPTFVSSTLTYTGSEQTILNSGSCGTGGVMYYYISTSSTEPTVTAGSAPGSGWLTNAPQQTNAGTYYAWYYCYVSDTTNNTGTGINTVTRVTSPTNTKEIARKKDATASAISNLVYNGTTETNGTTQIGVTGSNVTWSGTQSATNAGSYSATATPTANYAWSDGTYTAKTINWSIARRGQTAPVLNGDTKTYNASASASVKTAGTVADGVDTAPGTLIWTDQTIAANGIGSQTATAYYAATTTNFSASPVSSGVTVKVEKYTPSITLNVTSRPYNGDPLYASATIVYPTNPSGAKTPKGTIYYGTAPGATTYSVAYGGTAVNLTNVYVTNYNESTTVYAYFVPDTSCDDVYNTSSNANKSFSITGKEIAILPTTITGDAATAGDVSYHNVARATVSRDASGGTLQYSISTDEGSTWSSWSTVTWTSTTSTLTANPSRTAVGTTHIKFRVAGDSNHENSAESTPVTITVRPAADANLTVDLVSTSPTYNGNESTAATAQTIATVDTSSTAVGGKYHGIASYSIGYKKGSTATADGQVTWSTTPLEATDAGTYYVYVKYTVNSDHSNNLPWTNHTANYVGSVTINKATGYLTATATDRTYNGNPQTIGLISTNSGTYYFGLGSSSTVAPTSWGNANTALSATAAGDYYVWVKCDTSDNYNEVSAKYIGKATIGKANGSVTYTLTTASKSYWCVETAAPASTLQGDKSFTVASSSATGTGSISYTVSPSSDFSISSDGKTLTVKSGTSAGTYTVTIRATAAEADNYMSAYVDKTVSVEVKANVLEYITLTLAESTIAYNGETTAIVEAYYTNSQHTPVTTDSGTTYKTNNANIISMSDLGGASFVDGGA